MVDAALSMHGTTMSPQPHCLSFVLRDVPGRAGDNDSENSLQRGKALTRRAQHMLGIHSRKRAVAPRDGPAQPRPDALALFGPTETREKESLSA
jgi:hypothetical protein